MRHARSQSHHGRDLVALSFSFSHGVRKEEIKVDDHTEKMGLLSVVDSNCGVLLHALVLHIDSAVRLKLVSP